MIVSFFFAWFDLWVGAYYDQRKRILYVCPLPCCVVKIQRKQAMTDLVEATEQWQTQAPWSAMRIVLDAAFQSAEGNDELWADCERIEAWVDEHQIGDESCETLHPETRKET